MAYRHYHTKGLIINSRPAGEANRFYQIFTADFGLIFVLAQGVRLEKSKLRYHLTNYTLVELELVRGREYWRLVGAGQPYPQETKRQTTFFHKLALILGRLIHGEGANTEIFADLIRAEELLTLEKRGQLADLEIFMMIRLLANLGYLAQDSLTGPIIRAKEFDWAMIGELIGDHPPLIKLINQSLLASGL